MPSTCICPCKLVYVLSVLDRTHSSATNIVYACLSYRKEGISNHLFALLSIRITGISVKENVQALQNGFTGRLNVT